MAGTPSFVPGILTITLGRSTAVNRKCASSMEPCVSWATPGDTSIETKPSVPPLAR